MYAILYVNKQFLDSECGVQILRTHLSNTRLPNAFDKYLTLEYIINTLGNYY